MINEANIYKLVDAFVAIKSTTFMFCNIPFLRLAYSYHLITIFFMSHDILRSIQAVYSLDNKWFVYI